MHLVIATRTDPTLPLVLFTGGRASLMDNHVVLNDTARCRICGGNQFFFVQEAPYLRLPGMCRFFACKDCQTVYDSHSFNSDSYAGSNTLYEWPDIKFYVECGASLELLAKLLCFLRQIHRYRNKVSRPRFLDIGTGFGFAVSMAQSLQWDAIGVEPSDFGKLGSQYLGINIIHDYLENASLPQNSFDFILLSDVIEHVVDPKKLVASAAKYLTPDGVMLVATPNGEVLAGHQKDGLADVLSPGYHITILSPKSLQLVFEESGFEDIRMYLEGGMSGRKAITALAARKSGVLGSDSSWASAKKETASFVEDYLVKIVRDREQSGTKDILYGGALFRLLAKRMSAGDYCGAETYEEKIEALLETSDWNTRRIAQLQATDFFSYVQQVPAYLGMFCFYRGLLNLNHRQNFSAAIRDFNDATFLFQIEQNTQIYPRVGWHERTQYHLGLAKLRLGHIREALQVFDQLVANPQKVPGELWKGIYLYTGLAHLRLYHMRLAVKYFLLSQSQPPMRLRDRAISTLGAFLLGRRHGGGAIL